MSAKIELERVIVGRRNMQVLHPIMQSQRSSILEKQEAELTMRRAEEEEWIDLSVNMAHRHIVARRETLAEQSRALAAERRALIAERRMLDLEEDKEKITTEYWALLDGCMEVVDERKENSRGHMRKLPAAWAIEEGRYDSQ